MNSWLSAYCGSTRLSTTSFSKPASERAYARKISAMPPTASRRNGRYLPIAPPPRESALSKPPSTTASVPLRRPGVGSRVLLRLVLQRRGPFGQNSHELRFVDHGHAERLRFCEL